MTSDADVEYNTSPADATVRRCDYSTDEGLPTTDTRLVMKNIERGIHLLESSKKRKITKILWLSGYRR